MSKEDYRRAIQKALVAAVDGAKVETISEASARLESGVEGKSYDRTGSFMMQAHARSAFTQ